METIADKKQTKIAKLISSKIIKFILANHSILCARRIMRVITRRATMLAGDRSQGIVEV